LFGQKRPPTGKWIVPANLVKLTPKAQAALFYSNLKEGSMLTLLVKKSVKKGYSFLYKPFFA